MRYPRPQAQVPHRLRFEDPQLPVPIPFLQPLSALSLILCLSCFALTLFLIARRNGTLLESLLLSDEASNPPPPRPSLPLDQANEVIGIPYDCEPSVWRAFVESSLWQGPPQEGSSMRMDKALMEYFRDFAAASVGFSLPSLGPRRSAKCILLLLADRHQLRQSRRLANALSTSRPTGYRQPVKRSHPVYSPPLCRPHQQLCHCLRPLGSRPPIFDRSGKKAGSDPQGAQGRSRRSRGERSGSTRRHASAHAGVSQCMLLLFKRHCDWY